MTNFSNEKINLPVCLDALMQSDAPVADICDALRVVDAAYSPKTNKTDDFKLLSCPLLECGVERLVDYSPPTPTDPDTYFQTTINDDQFLGCRKGEVYQPQRRWSWTGAFIEASGPRPDNEPPKKPFGGLAA
jgi:hypothetical protein